MSVHVKHLNADSTFLLTFSAVSSSSSFSSTPDLTSTGSFTALLDPWLAETGAPQYHPKFAIASRKIPAHISHLSQIDPPDVVIISQVNSDHCHEETLRQLPSELPHTTILAHPDAAKKIRSWRYFKSSKIFALPTYSDKNHNTVIRFAIPSRSPGSTQGEATVTLIRQARDMNKLHNAIAITYRPPGGGSLLSPASPQITTIPILHTMRSQPELSESQQVVNSYLRSRLSTPALRQHQKSYPPMFPVPPPTPPETPPESEQDPQEVARPASRLSSAVPARRNFHLRNPSDAPSYRQRSRGNSDATTKTVSTIITEKTMSTITDRTRASSISEYSKPERMSLVQTAMRPRTADGQLLPPSLPPPTVPLPPLPDGAPLSPSAYQSPIIPSPATTSSLYTMATVAARPKTSALGSAKTLSVLYAPHGINYTAVKPYATTHLVQSAALPLTLVMHPFCRIDNPWWFGGNISAGVPGGVEIVQKLMGQHWLKTHDEEKEESGFGLRLMKKGRWSIPEVHEILAKGTKSGKRAAGNSGCAIHELECGQEMIVKV